MLPGSGAPTSGATLAGTLAARVAGSVPKRTVTKQCYGVKANVLYQVISYKFKIIMSLILNETTLALPHLVMVE